MELYKLSLLLQYRDDTHIKGFINIIDEKFHIYKSDPLIDIN
jgi:hypothetical protein